jgi:hypothetical protein
MIFIPEINPKSFVLFYENRNSGTSWSIRDYSIGDGGVPKKYGPQDLNWTADDIHQMAKHSLDAPVVRTDDLAFWCDHTCGCNRKYLTTTPSSNPAIPDGAGSVPSMSAPTASSVAMTMQCNTSLHKWKDEILGDPKETAQQCRRLLECLPKAVLATKQAAPHGNKGPHPLLRKPRPKLENPQKEWQECHWEEALWRKYGQDNSVVVPGLWARILSYQVMLRNTNDDKGWGEIDLLAVAESGLPTIIELKRDTSKESPLRLLVQGCAYAIAVKECWDVFGPTFASRIATMKFPPHRSEPKNIPILCLAPSQYWAQCFQIDDLKPAWPIFHQLITALAELGFPVTFAAVHHQGKDELGLPNIVGVLPVHLPSRECEKDRSQVDASGRAYAGSQRQIQTQVNDFPEALDKAIADSLGSRFPVSARIRWVSPLKHEGYTEYRDGDFLQALGMQQYTGDLSRFWPSRGPCWDALARIEQDGTVVGCVMVEAKSHVDEFYKNDTSAKGASLAKIRTALKRTEEWLKISPAKTWLRFPDPKRCLYQCANRFAHLFLLRTTLGVPAFLVNVLFTDDPHSPTSAGQWKAGLSRIHGDLGISEFPDCYAEVLLPAIRGGKPPDLP